MNDCHPGPCRNENECNKKVKLFCSCRRIKRDFVCSAMQKQQPQIKCDDVCKQLKNEKSQAEAALLEQKRQAEKMRNQEEIEKFERKFKPRRKGKDKFDRKHSQQEANNNYWKYCILGILMCIVGVIVFYVGV